MGKDRRREKIEEIMQEIREEKRQVRISVRNFVEFLLRSGDIDQRRGGKTEAAMQEGARIHRMIQRRMGSEYEAEVFLRYREDTPKYCLIIEGRADGVITPGGKPKEGERKEEHFSLFAIGEQQSCSGVTIDEIKGTYRSLDKIKESEPVHLAQARVYAYIYAIKEELEEIRIRMTYCNLETEEIKYFFYEYTIEELREWFEQLEEEYKKWADFQIQWGEKRQESIKKIKFPFEYRPGQKELAIGVYHTIYHKRKLFLEAPTGVGKTISTVFPAVKAVGEELGERIFYFTAKTITRTVAEETFETLRREGLNFKTVTLTAKEKICFQEEVKCNPLDCAYAKGHFDRINAALYSLITKEHRFSKEMIEKYALEYQVCPFELALDCSLFSDGIIGDYNYLFDPHVQLKRFFGENVDSRGIFLIDEAHNLVERGRQMYSAVLEKEDFLALRKTIRPYSVKMEKQLNRCNYELLQQKKETEEIKKWKSIDGLLLALHPLYQTMNEYLENHNDSPVRDEVLELFFKISHFLMIAEMMNDNYVIYSEKKETGEFYVKLFCTDPAEPLRQCMEKGNSSILFSATFLPIQYYKKVLGGTEQDYEIYAHSPFGKEYRYLAIGEDVTSKYTRRGRKEYTRIAEYIHKTVNAREGNYMVFFPSYHMMQEIGEIYRKNYFQEEEIRWVFQKEFMREEEREEFLKLFTRKDPLKEEQKNKKEKNRKKDQEKEDKKTEEVQRQKLQVEGKGKSLLGFCVMGGIFSEGIDLKQDSLIGAIIVGTGLPQVCAERELLKEYYQQNLNRGFDYAYRYPGMNKVLQAAGRVIRTSEDKGIILLLDERFLENSYRELFPREWIDFQRVTVETLTEGLEKFWKQW